MKGLAVIKIIAINFTVFLGLLIACELGMRIYVLAKTCVSTTCNFHLLTNLRIASNPKPTGGYIGLSRQDPILGFVPQENFDSIINGDGWPNIRVTINSHGFRDFSLRQKVANQLPILAVGDSFVFGDQVANDGTWPACLEKKLNLRVDNGGVFGYGALQAILRAQHLLQKTPYSTVILTLYLNDDIARDQLHYRFGFAKPALIQTRSGIAIAPMPDPIAPGTKFNPQEKTVPGFIWLYTHSIIINHVINAIYNGVPASFYDDRRTEKHPRAATHEQILDWVLNQFAALPAPHKVLLLQYPSDMDNEEASKERAAILKKSRGLNFVVVDTHDELLRYPKEQLWSGHHTPFGNQIVCETLIKLGQLPLVASKPK